MPTVEKIDDIIMRITDEDIDFFGNLIEPEEFSSIFSPSCGYLYSNDLANIQANLTKANTVIAEHDAGFKSGNCKITMLTDIRKASIVLGWLQYALGGRFDLPAAKQLDNINKRYTKGVSLLKILPLVLSYQVRVNKLIDPALLVKIIEDNRVPVSEDDCPF